MNLSDKILYYGSVSSGRVIQEEDIKDSIKNINLIIYNILKAVQSDDSYYGEETKDEIESIIVELNKQVNEVFGKELVE